MRVIQTRCERRVAPLYAFPKSPHHTARVRTTSRHGRTLRRPVRLDGIAARRTSSCGHCEGWPAMWERWGWRPAATAGSYGFESPPSVSATGGHKRLAGACWDGEACGIAVLRPERFA